MHCSNSGILSPRHTKEVFTLISLFAESKCKLILLICLVLWFDFSFTLLLIKQKHNKEKIERKNLAERNILWLRKKKARPQSTCLIHVL